MFVYVCSNSYHIGSGSESLEVTMTPLNRGIASNADIGEDSVSCESLMYYMHSAGILPKECLRVLFNQQDINFLLKVPHHFNVFVKGASPIQLFHSSHFRLVSQRIEPIYIQCPL